MLEPQKNSTRGGKPKTRKERLEAEKRRANYTALAILVIIIIGVAVGAAMVVPRLITGGGGTGPPTTTNFDPITACVGGQSLVMHIHVKLQIIIDGSQEVIPANVGRSATCDKVVHTHDQTGEIHVESPVKYEFRLKHFFQIWGRPFTRDNILGNVADSTHTLNFRVNNQANLDYENLVLVDGQQIGIEYARKSSSSLVVWFTETPAPIIDFKLASSSGTGIRTSPP